MVVEDVKPTAVILNCFKELEAGFDTCIECFTTPEKWLEPHETLGYSIVSCYMRVFEIRGLINLYSYYKSPYMSSIISLLDMLESKLAATRIPSLVMIKQQRMLASSMRQKFEEIL